MEFYNKLSDGKKSILIGGILIIVLFSVIFYFADKRKKELYSDYSISSAKITEVKLNVKKGGTSRKNVALYYYVFKETKYNQSVEIYNMNVKVGDCYEIKISNINAHNSEIDLYKKVKC
ncbi:hypothetical protein [Tenacibaculum halocynthiae]|uniref:hypothetical protein n=1 Tax=Tenacibaculum halocynthiae TaxID=1254437 RepID=UPI003892EFB1